MQLSAAATIGEESGGLDEGVHSDSEEKDEETMENINEDSMEDIVQHIMTADYKVPDQLVDDSTTADPRFISSFIPSTDKTSHTSSAAPTAESTGVDEKLDISSTLSADDSIATVVHKQWQFEFDQDLEPMFSSSSLLSEESTLTSVMSAETIRSGSCCSKHKLGLKPGPPFPVGDVIFCIPPGRPNREGQRGFVMESDHPRYKIRFEDGSTVNQIMGSRSQNQEYSLFPRYNVPDQDDPFVEVRAQTLVNNGSFGMVRDSLLDSLRRVREEKEHAKAVKSDDARVPVEYWNDTITIFSDEERDSQLSRYRARGWSYFVRHLTQDCYAHMVDKYGPHWTTLPRKKNGKLTSLGIDQHAICHIIWHATNTSWFEYLAGSRLAYFRFPKRYRKEARDGVPIYFESTVPLSKSPQKPFRDQSVKARVRAKIEKALHRRYMINSGITLRAFIKYFGVPKGEFDIRVVYDGTASGLNDAIWVPSFWLPTSDCVTRSLGPDSFMADRDVGDCFLNYQLHHSAVPYTGVDLNPIYEPGEKVVARTVHFDRNGMGMKPSPYNSCKMGLIAEEICKGDRHNSKIASDGKEDNPFQWNSVRLNLPGPGYDPAMSWVSKLRKDGQLAADLFTYVDDERLVAPTRELAYQAAHVLAAKQAYLGIMDSSRKVRPPSQTPGAWAGSVIHVIPGLGVCQLVSEDKWDKLKAILFKWSGRLEAGNTLLSHSELLSDRGFLVYVTRTYPPMMPYLKGFHLTIEMWRGGSWRLPMPKQRLIYPTMSPLFRPILSQASTLLVPVLTA